MPSKKDPNLVCGMGTPGKIRYGCNFSISNIKQILSFDQQITVKLKVIFDTKTTNSKDNENQSNFYIWEQINWDGNVTKSR